MKSTASAKHRIFQALFATVILVTVVFAVPSTNAKYSTSKSYTISITSIVKSLVPVYLGDNTKIINLTKTNIPNNSASILNNANTNNESTGVVYCFSTHAKTSPTSELAYQYTIDGVKLYYDSEAQNRPNATLDGYSPVRHWTGPLIVGFLDNTMHATNLTPIGVYPYTYPQGFLGIGARPGNRYNDEETFRLTVTENLTEGWYYTQIPFSVTSSAYRNTMYVFSLFYLPAEHSDGINEEKIAIVASPDNPKVIEFRFTAQRINYTNMYVFLSRVTFQQAHYGYQS